MYWLCILIFSPLHLFSQVGINTYTPNGILDVNSTTEGIVLPRRDLTSTIVQAPVTNPQGGNIPTGTVIYNTNTTNSGTNDVYPGMYVWDGAKWQPQFPLRQQQLYQSSTGYRSVAGTSLNVLGSSGSQQSFTANYSGDYKITVRVNFGGGYADVPKVSGGSPSSRSDGYMNIAGAYGVYTLRINNAIATNIPVQAFSTAYEPAISATNYFAIWQEYSLTFYRTMTANETITFYLTFLQSAAPEFINNGTSSTGRGYVAYDIPCTVEINYMGE